VVASLLVKPINALVNPGARFPHQDRIRPDADYAVIEYTGVQRVGKSTLMVSDILLKGLSPDYAYGYKPEEIYANYFIDIPGVHCGTNEQMVVWLQRAKREVWRHVWFSIDEASQPPLPLYARGFSGKEQTELVTSFWQIPKKGCVLQYTSNIGNSVDIQARDATFLTICVLKYNHGLTRDLDSIDYTVINNYDQWTYDERFHAPALVQSVFDSFQAVN
jgi:phage terminase large subunit-like protein